MQNNHGVILAGTCDTIANLIATGFLPANYVIPAAANSKYLGAAIGVAAGVITITGNAQASSCVVTLTPTAVAGQASVRWDAATAAAPAGCNRSKTGVGS
jgi:hypothetical protein